MQSLWEKRRKGPCSLCEKRKKKESLQSLWEKERVPAFSVRKRKRVPAVSMRKRKESPAVSVMKRKRSPTELQFLWDWLEGSRFRSDGEPADAEEVLQLPSNHRLVTTRSGNSNQSLTTVVTTWPIFNLVHLVVAVLVGLMIRWWRV